MEEGSNDAVTGYLVELIGKNEQEEREVLVFVLGFFFFFFLDWPFEVFPASSLGVPQWSSNASAYIEK